MRVYYASFCLHTIFMKTRSHLTIFLIVKTTTEWLALAPAVRFEFVRKVLVPLLAKHADIQFRFFDVEAFSARASDVFVLETADLSSYQSLVEALRETAFWDRYFSVLDILPGFEDGYADHYGVEAFSSPKKEVSAPISG
jgi:hypothetical protein